jgi:hypothetical protein
MMDPNVWMALLLTSMGAAGTSLGALLVVIQPKMNFETLGLLQVRCMNARARALRRRRRGRRQRMVPCTRVHCCTPSRAPRSAITAQGGRHEVHAAHGGRHRLRARVHAPHRTRADTRMAVRRPQGLAAGLMLSISVFDLFQESQAGVGTLWANIWFFAGLAGGCVWGAGQAVHGAWGPCCLLRGALGLGSKRCLMALGHSLAKKPCANG